MIATLDITWSISQLPISSTSETVKCWSPLDLNTETGLCPQMAWCQYMILQGLPWSDYWLFGLKTKLPSWRALEKLISRSAVSSDQCCPICYNWANKTLTSSWNWHYLANSRRKFLECRFSHQKYLFQVLQPGEDISGRSVSLESREGEQVSTLHLPRVEVSNYRQKSISKAQSRGIKPQLQTKCTSNDSLWS